MHGHLKVVSLLLKYGVNVNARDVDFHTALDRITRHGPTDPAARKTIIRLFLNRRCNDHVPRDVFSQRASNSAR